MIETARHEPLSIMLPRDDHYIEIIFMTDDMKTIDKAVTRASFSHEMCISSQLVNTSLRLALPYYS